MVVVAPRCRGANTSIPPRTANARAIMTRFPARPEGDMGVFVGASEAGMFEKNKYVVFLQRVCVFYRM